jgi:2-phosphoglycerate kinase
LVDLGAITILLTVSQEAVEERIQSRSPAQWLGKSKAYIAAQCDELLKVQDMLREQSKKSLIPTMEINTDSKDWSLFAKQIWKQID